MGRRLKEHVDCVCEECGVLFTVEPYRAKKARYCSWPCGQRGKAKISSLKWGEKQRFGGCGKSYVKFMGRHLHRVVMEEKIGRPLKPGEVVHHIDGNKRNNHPGNLELLQDQSLHIRLHRPRLGLGVVNKLNCTVDGCESKQACKGFCKRHYLQEYRRKHA